MKTNLLIFGTKNFNNSLDEIKEDLSFSLTFFDIDKTFETAMFTASAIIVDNKICTNETILSEINKISNKYE